MPVGLVGGPEHASDDAGLEGQDDLPLLRLGVQTDQAADLHDQPRLFVDLANHRLRYRLVRLDAAAGEVVPAAIDAPGNEHAAMLIADDGEGAHPMRGRMDWARHRRSLPWRAAGSRQQDTARSSIA